MARRQGQSLNWIALLGDFRIDGNVISFSGGDVPKELGDIAPVGNLISDCSLGSGEVSATITFSESPEQNSAGVILYHRTGTGGFLVVRIGGPCLCEVAAFSGREWRTLASTGPASQLIPGRKYEIHARAFGSMVEVKVDGVPVLVARLPGMLPKGPVGVWALGRDRILIENFQVRTERASAFVVLQYTPPYNELFSDVIKPIAEKMGYDVVRADDVYGPGLIISDIERQIMGARIVIAEISPANPNVYWEVGFAHARGVPTVLIAEKGTTLPFDVSPFRVLFYENSIAGKRHVELGLEKHLQAIESSGE